MRAALMVYYLERIADYGVDVGGSTVFLVTEQRIEDAMRQYIERDLGAETLPARKIPDTPDARWRGESRKLDRSRAAVDIGDAFGTTTFEDGVSRGVEGRPAPGGVRAGGGRS
jgi:hypothetical protein